jgi:AraC-like DNA-binding protein
MADFSKKQLSVAAQSSPTIRKLEDMAHDLLGASLTVLMRRKDRVVRLNLGGGTAELPTFCKLMRRSPGGQRHCQTCRLLVTLAVRLRGLTEHTCHGGTAVLATAVPATLEQAADSLIVSSCAFASEDRDRGWKAASRHAEDIAVDKAALREAYYELPVLSESSRNVMSSIIDLTASAISELDQYAHWMQRDSDGSHPKQTTSDGQTLDDSLSGILALSRDQSFGGVDRKSGSALTDLVMAMVCRDPALPFSVATVARAAHMTPNHFSMVFRRHSGVTFTAFLTEQRLNFARKQLSDLSLSVSEVSYRCGFQDTNYFSRRFKQVTGLSPRQWREQQTGDVAQS